MCNPLRGKAWKGKAGFQGEKRALTPVVSRAAAADQTTGTEQRFWKAGPHGHSAGTSWEMQTVGPPRPTESALRLYRLIPTALHTGRLVVLLFKKHR